MIYLLIAFITYTILKDILWAINAQRIFNEMKTKNKEIEEDNKKWKQEVRDLLKK